MTTIEKIEHIIVLMYENRSFHHLLGALDHPDSEFRGISGSERNWYSPGLGPATPTQASDYSIPVDPDHHHEAVMRQLLGRNDFPEPYPPVTNCGFAWDFEERAFRREKGSLSGQGPRVMEYHTPDRLPVLSTLAMEFALCDRWFCSVPGQTWPNRLFAHAATSDGEVNNNVRLYRNPTIFGQLSQAKVGWRVYGQHRVVPLIQSLALTDVLTKPGRVKRLKRVVRDIRADNLAAYSFIEPRYKGKRSSSQHPSNNLENGRDFLRGEELLLDIYEALVSTPRVWRKTALVVTYDEHGGLYDPEPPPCADAPSDTCFASLRSGAVFEFDLLGPRVPTVVVSPYTEKHRLGQEVHDHTSIISTVRNRFAPDTGYLTDRDKNAMPLDYLVTLQKPRDDIPDPASLREVLDELMRQEPETRERPETNMSELDDFQQSLFQLAELVRQYWNRKVSPDCQMERSLNLQSVYSPRELEQYGAELLNLQRELQSSEFTFGLPDGSWIDNPSPDQVQSAIEVAARSARSNVVTWIEDHQDRVLRWRGDGSLQFLNLESDQELSIEGASTEQAIEAFGLFQSGQKDSVLRLLDGLLP